MRSVDIGEGYRARAELIESGETVVQIMHPNHGWCPWFSLALQHGRWKFTKESSATEDWVLARLAGVKGLHPNVQSWLKQRRV